MIDNGETYKVETQNGKTIKVRHGELALGNFMIPNTEFPKPTEEALEFVKNDSFVIQLYLAEYYEFTKANKLINGVEERLKLLIEGTVENVIKSCKKVLH